MYAVFLSFLESHIDDSYLNYLREDLLGVFNTEKEAQEFLNEILEYLPKLRKEVSEGIEEMEKLGYNQHNLSKGEFNWFYSNLIPLDLLLEAKDFKSYFVIKKVPSKISLFTLQKPNTEKLLPKVDSATGNFVFAELLKNL